jgi:hypothetical protein
MKITPKESALHSQNLVLKPSATYSLIKSFFSFEKEEKAL